MAMRAPRLAAGMAEVAIDRRTLLLGAAGLTGAAPLLRSAPAWGAPQVQQAAPDFSAVDSNGATQSLSALRGKIVVLEWTNHDCPYVRKHYGANNMQNLQRDVTGAGAVWLTVISSAQGEQGYVPPEQANNLTRSRNAAPTAVLLDPKGTMGRAYSAQTTPHMFVINQQGMLVYMGGIDSIATTRGGSAAGDTLPARCLPRGHGRQARAARRHPALRLQHQVLRLIVTGGGLLRREDSITRP